MLVHHLFVITNFFFNVSIPFLFFYSTVKTTVDPKLSSPPTGSSSTGELYKMLPTFYLF